MIASLSFTFTSCYFDKRIQEELNELPAVVSYTNDIQPIWNANCTNCHNASFAPDLQEGTSFNAIMNNYVTAGNASSSTLFKVLNGQGVLMPPAGKISQNNINLVEKWINDGALNN